MAARVRIPSKSDDSGRGAWRAAPIVPPSESVDEFCQAEGISRRCFYNLVNAGQGPEIYYILTSPRISQQAHQRWREERASIPPPQVRRGRPRKLAVTP